MFDVPFYGLFIDAYAAYEETRRYDQNSHKERHSSSISDEQIPGHGTDHGNTEQGRLIEAGYQAVIMGRPFFFTS